MQSVEDLQEVDFTVLKEDYSRWRISDGAIIKAKVVVKKIFFSTLRTPEGYPQSFSIDSINSVTALVPPSLKGKPSNEPVDPSKDKGEEMVFDELDVKKQEYMTNNGYRIEIKPVITKVFKYSKRDIYGYPVYNVSIQMITNIYKIESI